MCKQKPDFSPTALENMFSSEENGKLINKHNNNGGRYKFVSLDCANDESPAFASPGLNPEEQLIQEEETTRAIKDFEKTFEIKIPSVTFNAVLEQGLPPENEKMFFELIKLGPEPMESLPKTAGMAPRGREVVKKAIRK